MSRRALASIITFALVACGSVTDPSGTCPDGQVECNEACVDLMSDPANCGECGTMCTAAVHSSRACFDGHCGIECHEGFFDIDGDELTGCEYACDYLGEIDECNGLDDDCDGTIDNFDTDTCAQGATVQCTTTCGSTGTGLCDSWCNPPTASECEPPAEECNGLDDDCDTVADQTFDCAAGEVTDCTTTCGSTGTGGCLDTCQVPPPGACIPPAEICNGLDDDCMLGADDTFDCVAGQETDCTTTCGSTGTATCSDECTIPTGVDCTPPAELCNWVDDDCDGDIDEALWAELIGDVQVSDPLLYAGYGRLEFGNTNFLVAWSQDPPGDGGHGLYVQALDRSGATVGGGDLAAGPDMTLAQDVAWSGSEFVVGFVDSRYGSPDVWGIRVAENGEPPSVEGIISNQENAELSVRVEWTGSDVGFGWIDQRIGTRIFLAEADASSLVVSYEENLTTGGGFLFGNIDMVWNGSGYGVCWGDNRTGAYQLWFKTVTPEGLDVIADTQLTTTFGSVNECTLAWTGSQYVLGWTGRDSGAAIQAYVARVGTDGSVVGSMVGLGQGISSVDSPSVWVETAGSFGLGVGWVQPGASTDNVMLQRFDFDLDPVGLPLRVTGGTYDAQGPSLAWDGSAFGVVWVREQVVDDNDVMFTRVGCP